MNTAESGGIWRLRVPLLISAALLIHGCGLFQRSTLYSVKSGYSFRGKTLGLCVILDGDEQEALDETRVARRTISSTENEGYAGDPATAGARIDAGIILPPTTVNKLDVNLKHSLYYDEDLIHPMIEQSKTMLERRGYRVEIVSVPGGEVRVQELADQARTKGCQLLAVETVALARSWNIGRPYQSPTSGELSTSFQWQLYVGGLVLTNMSIFDITSGEVVWQHARRDISAEFLGPILAELRNDNLPQGEFAAHPGQYQAWMYRQSAARSLHLLFRTLEPGFVPLPAGSSQLDSIAAARRYAPGDEVLVQPLESEILWLPATVVSDEEDGVHLRWPEGVWHGVSERTTLSRTRVMPKPNRWPPIVWVRARETSEYRPFRFVRETTNNLVYVELAGDASPRTFLAGRVGVASDLLIPED